MCIRDRGGDAEGSRVARRGTAHPERAAYRLGIHLRSVGRGHSSHGAVGDRTGGNHHGGSACRAAGRHRSRVHSRRPGYVLQRCGGLGDRVEDRHGAPGRRRRIARGCPHHQFRGRVLRHARGPACLRQFARFRGRVSGELLLAVHGSGGPRGRIHGARLLVHDGARVRRTGEAGRRGPHRRATRPAATGRAQGRDAEGAGGF